MSNSLAVDSVVEGVVQEKVNVNESFTAFDVTQEVRKRGHKAYHDSCKKVVHDCYERGVMGIGYTRTSIPIKGASGQTAYLYHPQSTDPYSYANYESDSTSVAPTPSVIQVPSTTTESEESDEDDFSEFSDHDDIEEEMDKVDDSFLPKIEDVFANKISEQATNGFKQIYHKQVDARQCLLVPAKAVRLAGFKPGDRAYLAGWGKFCSLLNESDFTTINAKKYGSYKVDRANNIRVTQTALKRAGYENLGTGYDLTFQDSRLVITRS